MDLQDRICSALETEDGAATFDRRRMTTPSGGLARPRVLDGGAHIERAAVNFSSTRGQTLPPAATTERPHLAGAPFAAVSVSLIVHPRNPHAPTSHANFRFFMAGGDGDRPKTWWFGGGFDLTPYYGYEADAQHWHTAARAACAPFGEDLYPELKRACDEYFFLSHRNEPRGIGGIFFDDRTGDFDREFAFLRSAGDHYLPAYLPILRRRKEDAYGEREREFQLYRRGRYVEFNLVHDRGTKYGLQSGGRIESVLASMPPLVRWAYDWHPEPGTPEARLYDVFLQPRDWV